MIPLDAEIVRNTKVAARDLGEGEGGVLLHLESGQYHGLNNMGWVIWTFLNGARTFGEIVAEVRARVPDTPSDLEQDVARYLEELRARDLIDMPRP